ncbi:hypothetical protein HK098_001155 [Nowakowskiella sp. JEL0407]|nr:hypothetical protein HK098_001155 [Nowakowskiella sp. JEL0407]
METSQITFGDLSFDINKPFARGAISTDHLGKWNGNQVIFKVILDTLDENIVDEILKEFDILSRYRHQNIVVFYGVSSELSGPPVIVSEHADCGSLASVCIIGIHQ